MIAFAEASVAAAQKDVQRALDELKAALVKPMPEAWRHVGATYAHLVTAKARLDNALQLDRIASELEEKTG